MGPAEYMLDDRIPHRPAHVQPLIIVQARMESTRLPGKVMLPLEGLPLLEGLLKRLFLVRVPVVLATSTSSKDERLVKIARRLDVPSFQGSEEDVLDRFYRATKERHVDAVVRITADCPLTDPHMVDRALDCFYHYQVDYLSNTLRRTFPKGFDIEIFRASVLEECALKASTPYEREHVTPYIVGHPERFRLANFASPDNFSAWRLTVDTHADYDLVALVMSNVHGETSFESVKRVLLQHPDWQGKNTPSVSH